MISTIKEDYSLNIAFQNHEDKKNLDWKQIQLVLEPFIF